MKQNLQTLKGFRDFLPEEKRRRDFVMGKIVEVFERFGFEPLETPTLEYASLLLGKYGSEADKLVYTFEDAGGRRVGLKYDQTVPTSRVLAQYREKLPKYFRRYQIQNVFRAEKPQKGRFREFTQCDIDIFGTTSPLSDAEIVACTYQVYKNIGFPDVVIKLNDRVVITTALTPLANKKVTVSSIIQSIDKLDKTSEYEVEQELINKGLDMETAKKALETLAAAEPSDNLVEIMEAAKALGVPEEVVIYEPSLARGLDYYTGMILEVVIPEFTAGSVAGGGRYDKLFKQRKNWDCYPKIIVALAYW
jgi:histidyl-tRNA synthetase